ncbi:MAG: AIR synthase-related protein [Chloroflexota bacterium]|nr:AIR synthase-related protein [Chloroflexota bacterium]
MNLPAGKLPPELLRQFLRGVPTPPPDVVLGAAVGEDAAVLDLGGDELLVAASDPITFGSAQLARDLLAVNENDLVTTGARPRWLVTTLLLPEGIDADGASQLLEDLAQAARAHGVALVGGHTEITVGLDRPMAIGCLLGTVPRGGVVRTSGARVGDAVILTGGVAIEGTAILAEEHVPALRARGVAPEVIAAAARLRHEPGIAVRRAAETLLQDREAVHAMHDPTEGGVITALHELAEAAQAGLTIDRAAIPVFPECRAVCGALGLDPLGLIASGALLVAVDPAAADHALARLQSAGIDAARIGWIVDRDAGTTLATDDAKTPLPTFARDELARYLESR